MKSHFTHLYISTILVTILLLFVGCTKENEPEFIEEIVETAPCAAQNIEFTLLNDSFKSIPYIKEKTLIFTDSLNNEISLEFSPKKRTFYTTQGSINCALDNSKKTTINAKIDTFEFDLTSNNAIDLSILFRLQAVIGFDKDSVFVRDMLDIITFPKAGGSNISQLNIQVNQRTNYYFNKSNNFHNSVESIQLNGKTYYDVFYDHGVDNLYYNYELGLVAFRDKSKKLWVLKN